MITEDLLRSIAFTHVRCFANVVDELLSFTSPEEIDRIVTIVMPIEEKQFMDKYATIFSILHRGEILNIYYIGSLFKIKLKK